MAEPVKISTSKEIAVVNTAWVSKINATQVVVAVVGLATALGIAIPEEWQKLALQIATMGGAALTFIWRTWFTTTPPTAAELKTAVAIKKA